MVQKRRNTHNSLKYSNSSNRLDMSVEKGQARDTRVHVCVCVLLCLLNPILGDRYGPGVIPFQGTWGGRILTLYLNYVARYTDPLLFLFERTHNYYVDSQGLVPWRLRRLGRSKVRSASLVRVLSDGKISWALGPQGLCSEILHLPQLKQSNIRFFEGKKRKEKKTPRRGTHVARI